ncbi:hypothetical protein DFH09DRAFT_1075386 [Mycena vulgaris]|nr:hypothetical protein DFH09DRAFT_1075386 [Mycena vulgaris]
MVLPTFLPNLVMLVDLTSLAKEEKNRLDRCMHRRGIEPRLTALLEDGLNKTARVPYTSGAPYLSFQPREIHQFHEPGAGKKRNQLATPRTAGESNPVSPFEFITHFDKSVGKCVHFLGLAKEKIGWTRSTYAPGGIEPRLTLSSIEVHQQREGVRRFDEPGEKRTYTGMLYAPPGSRTPSHPSNSSYPSIRGRVRHFRESWQRERKNMKPNHAPPGNRTPSHRFKLKLTRQESASLAKEEKAALHESMHRRGIEPRLTLRIHHTLR